MTDSADALLIAIARCPIARRCVETGDGVAGHGAHPCARLVLSQGATTLADHLPPEPWDGDLAHAPILFFGSNPNLDPDELFPAWDWPDADLIDFFTRRFGGGSRAWTHNLCPVLRDGTYRPHPTAFWTAVRRRAAELLDTDAPVPGQDYALAGVVRCKSSGEFGVRAAFDTCTRRYLEPMLAASAARVVVGMGVYAGEALRRVSGIPPGVPWSGPLTVAGRTRYLAFLPHPNARLPRTFANCLPPDGLAALRAALANR